MEILWRHPKRSRLVNVLFKSLRGFRQYLDNLLNDFAVQPDLTLQIITPNCRRANRKHSVQATWATMMPAQWHPSLLWRRACP